jgi:hypothetical protein
MMLCAPNSKGPNITLLNVTDPVLKLGLVEILWRERFEFGVRELLPYGFLFFFFFFVFLRRGGWEANANWGGCGGTVGCLLKWTRKSDLHVRGLALKMSCSPPLLLAILTVLSFPLLSLCLFACLKVGFQFKCKWVAKWFANNIEFCMFFWNIIAFRSFIFSSYYYWVQLLCRIQWNRFIIWLLFDLEILFALFYWVFFLSVFIYKGTSDDVLWLIVVCIWNFL